MVSTFRGLYGLTDGRVTEAERARMTELVKDKFLTEDWLKRVP